MIAAALFALVAVSFVVVPFFRPIAAHARIAGISAGLGGVLISMAFALIEARSPLVNLLTICGTAWLIIAMRFGKTAWRDYSDRQMTQRAEAYQARVDAQRETQAG
jgi:hypothetical protein